MRLTLVLALAMAVLPACKSSPPKNYEQMKKKVPDAKPTLYVAEDDQRYVATSGDNARQIHYYSVQMDRTYVVDEKTGVVVTTFQAKEMPGVVVIDKPTYQPPPLKANEPKETPTEGCAPAKEEPAKEAAAPPRRRAAPRAASPRRSPRRRKAASPRRKSPASRDSRPRHRLPSDVIGGMRGCRAGRALLRRGLGAVERISGLPCHIAGMSVPRVVVTGMGAITCLGLDADSTWDAMVHGRSGIGTIVGEEFDRWAGQRPVTIAGQVRGWGPRAAPRPRDEPDGPVHAARHLRVDRGGRAFRDRFRARGSGALRRCHRLRRRRDRRSSAACTSSAAHGPNKLSPYTVPRLMINCCAGLVSIRFGSRLRL